MGGDYILDGSSGLHIHIGIVWLLGKVNAIEICLQAGETC